MPTQNGQDKQKTLVSLVKLSLVGRMLHVDWLILEVCEVTCHQALTVKFFPNFDQFDHGSCERLQGYFVLI